MPYAPGVSVVRVLLSEHYRVATRTSEITTTERRGRPLAFHLRFCTERRVGRSNKQGHRSRSGGAGMNRPLMETILTISTGSGRVSSTTDVGATRSHDNQFFQGSLSKPATCISTECFACSFTDWHRGLQFITGGQGNTKGDLSRQIGGCRFGIKGNRRDGRYTHRVISCTNGPRLERRDTHLAGR